MFFLPISFCGTCRMLASHILALSRRETHCQVWFRCTCSAPPLQCCGWVYESLWQSQSPVVEFLWLTIESWSKCSCLSHWVGVLKFDMVLVSSIFLIHIWHCTTLFAPSAEETFVSKTNDSGLFRHIWYFGYWSFLLARTAGLLALCLSIARFAPLLIWLGYGRLNLLS